MRRIWRIGLGIAFALTLTAPGVVTARCSRQGYELREIANAQAPGASVIMRTISRL